jgi:hypothetical protein
MDADHLYLDMHESLKRRLVQNQTFSALAEIVDPGLLCSAFSALFCAGMIAMT